MLVLDEPTIGIDPIQVVETRNLIQELGRAQTVVLSSHILPEVVSMICERVLINHEGRIVAEDTPQNLAESCRVSNGWKSKWPALPQRFCPCCRRLTESFRSVTATRRAATPTLCKPDRDGDLRDDISRAVISSGWSLRGMQMVGMSLEEIFLRLTTQEDL